MAGMFIAVKKRNENLRGENSFTVNKETEQRQFFVVIVLK